MLSFLVSMRKPLILWASVTLFFAFQFILRLSPGILMDDIMIKYQMDTIAFGSMVGVYYLGYSLMLIPLGILLDKFNFRYVTVSAIFLTVLGNSIFIFFDELYYAYLGRFMIGAGSAVGFLSVVKVIRTFFESKYQSFMIGLSFSFGLTGAVLGAKPMKMLINYFGYYEVLALLSVVAIIIASIILLVNHEDLDVLEKDTESNLSFTQIIQVLFNPKILIIGISGGLLVGSLEGFSDAWGFPFFEQIYNIDELDSKFLTSVVYIGMLFGGPILVYFASIMRSYSKVIILDALLMIGIFILLLAKFDLSYNMMFILMFALGILCCYQVLVFSLTASVVDKSVSGIAIAVINCLNMSIGSLFHKIIAYIMQFNWNGELSAIGGRIYDYDAFFYSLSVIPIATALGMFGFIYFIKYEKYTK